MHPIYLTTPCLSLTWTLGLCIIRKIFKFAKANWEAIKADCDSISSEIIIQLNQGTDIEELWSTFKDGIHRSVERNVPSKTCRNKYSLPWVDRKLCKSLKKGKAI